MASYHLSVKTVSRATGRSGPGAAAYRTATRIECERDGTVHDYTRRGGVDAAFVVTPAGAEWAQDRSALWNAVETAEKRKDAKVAREYELALPHELGREERHHLARAFAEEVVVRFGVVADVAVHEPGQGGDHRNWHAHVLTTTRAVSAQGVGAKTRVLDVKQSSGPAIEQLRELWGNQVNQALSQARVAERVDHRSFARQGRDQVAEQHLGVAATAMERRAELGHAAAMERDPSSQQAAPEPVTRIGQHNAEVRERNRVLEAARQALGVAREGVAALERQMAAGVRWVSGLARGLGAQLAGERQAKALEAERQKQALELVVRAEQERQRAKLAREQAQPAVTLEQRDTERQAGVWDRLAEAGRRAREAERAQRGPEQETPQLRPSRGPSMGF